MKKILIALIITMAAYCSAEAQANCKPKHVVRHKTTVSQSTVSLLPVEKVVAISEECRPVPFEACKIMADRMHVSCYKTMDLETLQPLGNETIIYGPTGKVPGEPMKFDVETTVISDKPKANYCKRDDANRQTICYTDEIRLIRDENGFYGYR